MRSLLVRRVTLAVVPAVTALALAGCGTEQPSAGGSPSSTPPSTAAPSPSAPSTVATPTGPATTPNATSPSNTADPSGDSADVTVNVTITDGKVNPSGSTTKVGVGQKVKITVTGDAKDELHVHGYDKTLPVVPGKPGSVTFTADTKGTFEVETHESGKLITKLVVS